MPGAVIFGVSVGTPNAPHSYSASNSNLGSVPVDGFYAVASAQLSLNDTSYGRFTVKTGLNSVSFSLTAAVGPDASKNEYSAGLGIGQGISIVGSSSSANTSLGESFVIDPDQQVQVALNKGVQVSYSLRF